MRSLLMIALGVVGSGLGVTTLVRTINRGSVRLRGERRVTATRHPYLFRADLVALWIVIIASVVILYLGLSDLLARE